MVTVHVLVRQLSRMKEHALLLVKGVRQGLEVVDANVVMVSLHEDDILRINLLVTKLKEERHQRRGDPNLNQQG